MQSRIVTRSLFILIIGLVVLNFWVSCRHQARDPLEGLHVGVHDKVSESSLIEFKENGLIQVQIAETHVRIVFRPPFDKLDRYRIGSIAPVTFVCNDKPDYNCDLSKKYKLYVSMVLVEPVAVVIK